jgi:hypothetical protein
MSAYPELDNLKLEQLIKQWHRSPMECEDYAASYYQEIVSLIRQQGEAGVNFLLTEVEKADSPKLAAILCMLPPVEDQTLIRDIWQGFLSDQRPEIVASAIDGLAISIYGE